MRSMLVLIAGLGLSAAALPAAATITVLNQWHLGEADAGASAGGAGAAATVDSVGGVNLNKVGAPMYSSDVTPRIGSTLSMAFNGTTDEYMNSGVASTLTDNFGVEAWVKWNAGSPGSAAIVYNGNSSNSGWGIYQYGTMYGLLYGGNLGYSVTPVSNQWTELALVRSSGTTTFYVNGVPSFATATGPNVPAGGVAIGGNSLTSGTELFNGKIDEVRIFSFAPGQFSAGDLNLPPPVATPVLGQRALALLALGLFGLAWLSLRRRISG